MHGTIIPRNSSYTKGVPENTNVGPSETQPRRELRHPRRVPVKSTGTHITIRKKDFDRALQIQKLEANEEGIRRAWQADVGDDA